MHTYRIWKTRSIQKSGTVTQLLMGPSIRMVLIYWLLILISNALVQIVHKAIEEKGDHETQEDAEKMALEPFKGKHFQLAPLSNRFLHVAKHDHVRFLHQRDVILITILS